ncbi:MAG: glycoside hydrolase family 13 protein [Actinobacteria bacterium]|nr:glycoside hydrolase family 13 protein [Actinomycetota bacterium]
MGGARAHHDGSLLYVSQPYPSIGDELTLSVRVDPELGSSEVFVRSTLDGDQRFSRCVEVDRGGAGDTLWEASITMTNQCMNYRFLIQTPRGGVTLNTVGLHDCEVTDVHDFRLTTDPEPPRWAAEAVFYEVFLDRFARGCEPDPSTGGTPDWAVPVEWDDAVAHGTDDGVRQVYGGDLRGLIEHLGHLGQLGVTAIYLTPFFPGTSNHRYDASTFDHVDPLLGGDPALLGLTSAAHARSIRVVGDLTLNHTGNTHDWFTAAVRDPSCPEAGFYLFTDHPHRYETFGGVPSMPKLDHRNPELRRQLFEGTGSVVHRYLEGFGLDGWRIDVAQSAGHCDASNRNLPTARATVATARAAGTDAYVIAEHQFDAGEALAGDAWHGTMAYAAFTRPLWSWLAERDIDQYWGVPAAHTPYTGSTMAKVMDGFTGSVPWRSRLHSLNLLDSHDTPRLLSIVGRERYQVAVGMLLTMPGIPMVFTGDEIGTHGVDLEDGRRPFRWDRTTWNHKLLSWYQQLIRLRRTHPALVSGGMRWVHTSDDVVIYERAHPQETLIVHAARRAQELMPCPVSAIDLLGDHNLSPGDQFPTGPGFGVWLTGAHPTER